MKIKIQLLYRFIVLLLIGYRFFDAPIEQVNNSFSVAGIFFRMRYLNDGHTILFVELYKNSMISSPCLEFRLPVGSSAKMSLGFATSALAIPTSCC